MFIVYLDILVANEKEELLAKPSNIRSSPSIMSIKRSSSLGKPKVRLASRWRHLRGASPKPLYRALPACPSLYNRSHPGSVTGSLQVVDMECTVGGCSRLGLTPFQCALAALDEGRRDSFARHLRAEGLDIDFDPSPRVGKSLLREALRRGDDGAVQELLNRGTSVHIDKTASKLSPIHLAVKPGSGISDETVKQMLLRSVTVYCRNDKKSI